MKPYRVRLIRVNKALKILKRLEEVFPCTAIEPLRNQLLQYKEFFEEQLRRKK